MQKPKIELLNDYGGDWSILRINGEEIESNHSIRLNTLLEWLVDNNIVEVKEYTIENCLLNGEFMPPGQPKWVNNSYEEHLQNEWFEETWSMEPRPEFEEWLKTKQ